MELATTEKTKASALAVMANRVSVDPNKLLETLKDTVFQKATNSELLALVVVANEYGLNPFLKEIYAFPAKGGGIVPVVSIDGWISMVNRQPQLDGMEFDFENDADGKPLACTCRIYLKDRSRPVVVTEYFDECFRATDPWKQMPKRMLRHKALIQCARVAFGFAGIQDDDEAKDTIKYAEASVVEREPVTMPKEIGGSVSAAAEAPSHNAELPLAEASDNLAKLRQALADHGISEAAFIKVLKMHKIKAATLGDLTEAHLDDSVRNFSDYAAEVQG